MNYFYLNHACKLNSLKIVRGILKIVSQPKRLTKSKQPIVLVNRLIFYLVWDIYSICKNEFIQKRKWEEERMEVMSIFSVNLEMGN